MREIKFRAWDTRENKMLSPRTIQEIMVGKISEWLVRGYILEQFTGLTDKNGKEIYEGDVIEFSDKWEWYRGSYGIKMHSASGDLLTTLQEEYEAEPMERRTICIPGDYEWLLSSEIQQWWVVIGSIHENPSLLETL